MKKVQGSRFNVQGLNAEAEALLQEIAEKTANLQQSLQAAEAEMNALAEAHNAKIEPLKIMLKADEAALLTLMKKNKGVIFDGTDVVNLPHGSLIHNIGEHVSIPKTALEACKLNDYRDAIIVVESLDRDVIRTWSDAKLTVIGAERKKKEEFKYTIKQ